jgi:hypothetical protein
MIFAFGVTVNIAGSLRTYYEHRSMIIKNLDHTWVGWPTCVCAIVEIGLGVVRFPFPLFLEIVDGKLYMQTKCIQLTMRKQIVTSAPALRPLMTRLIPSLLESTKRRNRYGGKGAYSGKYLYNSRGYKPRPPHSMRGFAIFDKPQNNDTSKMTASQIEMRPQSFAQEEGSSSINVARTIEQEFGYAGPSSSPFPERDEIESHSGGYGGPVGSYDRFHLDFKHEQQSITRLYDEESNEDRVQKDP